MLDDLSKAGLAIFGAIVTLAIVATLVGRGSQTASVIQSAAGGLSQVISAAVNMNAGASAHPGANVATTPSIATATSLLPGLMGT